MGRRTSSREDETLAQLAAQSKPAARFAPAWLDLEALSSLSSGPETQPTVCEWRFVLWSTSRAAFPHVPDVALTLERSLNEATLRGVGAALLDDWLRGGAEAKHRWVLTLASRWGGDEVAERLGRELGAWATARRTALAAHAISALAAFDSDRALRIIDAASRQYASRFPNVGRAAQEAIEAVATRRGVTVAALGDSLVPWLGFPSSGHRDVTIGGRIIRIGVDSALRLTFVDQTTGRALAKLPAAASSAMRQEMKEAAAELRASIRIQASRLESLLVAEHRWNATDWAALWTNHPILRAFAVRLIWGIYDDDGELVATFRALEDRSLTTVDDDEIELEGAAWVGIVHPIEIDSVTHEAWREHLAAWKVTPPFPQLDRPILHVPEEGRRGLTYAGVRGSVVHGRTLLGRAQKLGWRRGTIDVTGQVTTLTKRFDAAELDAFVSLAGMWVTSPDAEVELLFGFFAPAGSIGTGADTHPPADSRDPRLVAFGSVPPIVFSETIGDLHVLAGTMPTLSSTEHDG